MCYDPLFEMLGFLPVGFKVQVTGEIEEYFDWSHDENGGHTEIRITQPIRPLGFAEIPGDTIPTADLRLPVTGERWESVWITVADVYVIENDLPYTGWSIGNNLDGSDRVRLGTGSLDTTWNTWTNPPVGTQILYLSGWPYNHHGFYSDSSTYKIEPSFVSDVVFDLTGIEGEKVQVAKTLQLRQNYPNPFNPTTNINFVIPNSDLVRLTVFDLRGREVNVLVNQTLSAGEHSVIWNGMDRAGTLVSSGVYLIRLESGRNVSTNKMLLLR